MRQIQPSSRPFLHLDTHQNPLFEVLQDEMSETEISCGLGAGGRGGPPLNNNLPLNNDLPQPNNGGIVHARICHSSD
jgi:hypothetical protein